jgi:hypothetical protein
MTKHVQTLLGASIMLGSMAAPQSPLTARDYDDFYTRVVRNASNTTKAEWLASYDAVVSFIERVRQEVDRGPEPTKQALAKAVHDNGYWKLQQARVRDPRDPFLGAAFAVDGARLKAVLTPAGYESYRDRYAQGSRGYRFTLEAVADRAALYKLAGKDVPDVENLPATTAIVNANAQSWDDLVADASRYPNPAERVRVIVGNQLNAVASALSLMRGSQAHSDTEMDYATAVIWRYTGHFSGKDGWEKESLVRIPYAQLPQAEKEKDRPVWRAVRDALKAHPL